MRRKKVTYPKPKTATASGAATAASADARAAAAASRSVSIDLRALSAGSDVVLGGRVQIASGLYAGEFATIESVAGGVLPAVVVRTDAGRTRRVRAIDLVPAEGVADPSDPG
jgi:hypothetical protein